MRVSTVILPIYPWREGRDVWRSADDLGFHAAYTYDDLSWRSFRDGPWCGAGAALARAPRHVQAGGRCSGSAAVCAGEYGG